MDLFTACRDKKTIIQKVNQSEWVKAYEMHKQLLSKNDSKDAKIKHHITGHCPIEDFHRDLSSYLGKPKKLLYEAMENEHCNSVDSNTAFVASNYGTRTTSKIEWHFVIDPSDKTLEKIGLNKWPSEYSEVKPQHRRKPKYIDDFESELIAVNQKLEKIGLPRMTLIELIALRLYSGPMGLKYNKMIRRYTAGFRKGQEWRIEEERSLCLGNKYPTTLHVIQSAISKLGKINPNETGYCGSSGMLLHDMFWTDHVELHSRGGVEGGFSSLSSIHSVAHHYASLAPRKSGILFKFNMSTMDRGANINWLAQYPHEEETLLPPLTYLHVDHIYLDKTLHGEPMMVVEVRARISQSIQIQMPLLTRQENASIIKVARQISNHTDTITNSKLLSRFSDEKRFFISGNSMESITGLSQILGIDDLKLQRARLGGLKALEDEILASGEQEVITNMKYVLYGIASECKYPNGIRDLGNSGKRLIDFVNHPKSAEYDLREEHIAALRIYTTSAFSYINDPLRCRGNNENKYGNNQTKTSKQQQKPHPLPVTVSLIDDAIKRLRASTAKLFKVQSKISLDNNNILDEQQLSDGTYLWRGIKNTRIREDFLEGGKGGTELGLMSTTRDLKVAVSYSQSQEGNALLFKFNITTLKQFGADVSWLSAFPAEEEILYPPLTFLEPTGKVETTTINGMAFTVVEIEPHV